MTTCRTPWSLLAGLLLILTTGCAQHAPGHVSHSDFGMVNGQPVTLWTIDNDRGMTVKVMDYGATVTSLEVPASDGTTGDVVLGFDSVDEYVESSPYFGATVGRVGNRVADARFDLDGKRYDLAANNGPHHLHGGVQGFDKQIWKGTPITTTLGPGVRFRLTSPADEEGYPGRLDAEVQYVVTEDNQLRVVMQATSQERTPVNMLHHSYWNLSGHGGGSILDQELMVAATSYTPCDDQPIPTGAIEPVEGTPYDFREFHIIGERIDQLPGNDQGDPGGYDVNFVLEETDARLQRACVLRDPASGRVMEIWTNQPGLQFYTGNYLDGVVGKDGAVYEKNDALCLETQAFPDAVNKEGMEGWSTIILPPGETYRHMMIHDFDTE
ncbi:MAG: aldose epimerase family protein [Planctomycetota bacterium]|nr:aldose epimerase family protein [Planctomycetota bacterium]